ncbi:TetR/AcrR family transcriptional regulator [Streptomyces triculaminicus]|uniref:TetR/AcrR family transcriptional regulator n=2 Tax=Streptomyces TaxID=1883 RepID=A0A939FJH7_9ACTN|nr:MULTISPECIES: TetR/AcrR family transcriptional regulator [Streptomyces]MBO0651906.1 TetR/AcrR family transcriptional regulator [Streptomyces triculaminicus]QSY47175.1 TetR/AcrR family transcriptional regulator [Streptomyces griseocarneus]
MAGSREKKRDPKASLALLWGEQEQPRRGPKPSLTAERIVTGAIAIADGEGLDALSMQRVASELEVTTMALYRYVPGKAELIDLMVDTALGTPPAHTAHTADPGEWRPRLTEWARQCWALYRRHPWILTATAMRRQLMGPNQLAWLDAALAALEPTGLPAARQHDTVLLVIGHIRNLAQQLVDADETGDQEWNRLAADVLERHGHRYPALTAAIAAGAFAPHDDDPLDFGLERILDGVAALIARS